MQAGSLNAFDPDQPIPKERDCSLITLFPTVQHYEAILTDQEKVNGHESRSSQMKLLRKTRKRLNYIYSTIWL